MQLQTPYPEVPINILINYAIQNADKLDGHYIQHCGRLTLSSEKIYLLTEGNIRIEHRKTSITLGVFIRKMVIGIVEQNYSLEDLVYVTAKDTVILSVDSVKYLSALRDENLLLNLNVVTSYFVARLIECVNIILSKNAYSVIRALIERYDSSQHVSSWSKESLVSFILARCPLSRSMVMKILSDLRKGKYIVVHEDGRLEIIKKLPQDY
ncbi:helix-turn-helix domain-containing protein [Salmonella enterica]|uniref:helix-turn-helix domain-containing protein n=1 Tax=Citrobacter sp. wls710 TaxID=2576426 RepID=UPI0010CA04EE|nr:helix-turn-helix domain-containing protein [Citrobacter sp. wls710]EBK0028744.1 hypothetical protein [Salmonella enterica]EDN6746550.1 hypothetical protein [Salmonella enterica]ELI0025933.1 helix-turn-helix domain-containing protein [Salmonella enterica]ELI0151730.1 helix-turn-helix domain-containing protein [Salmonella enterica]TKU73341.1 hypothetical protein FDX14_11415 [Citrobacter sp. wls710]